MAKSKKSVLVTRIAQVIAAALAGENSKERIGGLLRDLLDSAPTEYDELATYEARQWIIWQGRLIQSLFPIAAGESPDSKPTKWFDPVASSAVQFGTNANDYLATQKGVVAYVAQQIKASGVGGVLPIADETKAGVSKRATLQAALEAKNNTDHITPVTLGAALDAAVQNLLVLLEKDKLFGSDINTEVDDASGVAVTVDELSASGVVSRVVKFMGRLKFLSWLKLGLNDLFTLDTDRTIITGGSGYKTIVNVDDVQFFELRYWNPIAQIWYNAAISWAKVVDKIKKTISLGDVLAVSNKTKNSLLAGGVGIYRRGSVIGSTRFYMGFPAKDGSDDMEWLEPVEGIEALIFILNNATELERQRFAIATKIESSSTEETYFGTLIGQRCTDAQVQGYSPTFKLTAAMVGVPQAHGLNAASDDIFPTLLDKNKQPDTIMVLTFPDAGHFLLSYPDGITGYEGGLLRLEAVGAAATTKIYRFQVYASGASRYWQSEPGESKLELGKVVSPLARRWKEINADLYGAASLTACEGMGEIDPPTEPVTPVPVMNPIKAITFEYNGAATSRAFTGYAQVSDAGTYIGKLIPVTAGLETPTPLEMIVLSRTVNGVAANRAFAHGSKAEGFSGVAPGVYDLRVENAFDATIFKVERITLTATTDQPNTTGKAAGYRVDYIGSNYAVSLLANPAGGTPPTVKLTALSASSQFSDTNAYTMRAFESAAGGTTFGWTENHYQNIGLGDYDAQFEWSDGTKLHGTITIGGASSNGIINLTTVTAVTPGVDGINSIIRKYDPSFSGGSIYYLVRMKLFASSNVMRPVFRSKNAAHADFANNGQWITLSKMGYPNPDPAFPGYPVWSEYQDGYRWQDVVGAGPNTGEIITQIKRSMDAPDSELIELRYTPKNAPDYGTVVYPAISSSAGGSVTGSGTATYNNQTVTFIEITE